MDKSCQNGVNRRDFLRSAALVAGTAVLGLPQRQVDADVDAAAASTPATTLAYWDNAFIDPRTLNNVDGMFYSHGAKITIHAHHVPAGAQPQLHFIDGHYAMEHNGALTSTPYFAWDIGQAVRHKAVFKMPVHVANGLTLSVEVQSRPDAPEYYFFTANAASGWPGLKLGAYVLAVGSPNWSDYAVVNDDNAVVGPGGAPADFEYVFINIAHG